MLKDKMLAQLNTQINAEMYSAYLYLSMSAYFSDIGLNGCANWMRMQAKEEQIHAMKIYDFIFERQGKVNLLAIDQPPDSWNSTLDAFKGAYEHEKKVTAMIDSLVDTAIELRDHATNSFLQWFVNEQVEEESTVVDIIQQLEMIGDNKQGIYMIDKELGARQAPVEPVDAAE